MVSIIIPGAGHGRRMKSYGPKPLFKLSDEVRLIDHQYRMIKENVVDEHEIIFVGGFKHERVIRHTRDMDIKHVHNDRHAETNVVDSLRIGIEAAKFDVIVVIYGDLYFNRGTIDNIDYDHTSILCNAEGGWMSPKEVGCTIDNGLVEHVLYDLDNKWAQVGTFVRGELAMLKKMIGNNKYRNYFLFEIMNEMIDRGASIKAIIDDEIKTRDIDNVADLAAVQELYSEEFGRGKRPSAV